MQAGNDYADMRKRARDLRRTIRAPTGARWSRPATIRRNFVQAMTSSGFLGALIPEEYGVGPAAARGCSDSGGDPCQRGCDAYACHAQMYMMGTVLSHGSATGAKHLYLPQIAAGTMRHQAFGVTEPTTGSDTIKLKTRAVRDGDDYVINGQRVWTSRASGLRPDDPAGAHDAGGSGEEPHRRSVGLPDRHQRIARQGPDDQADRHHGQPPHQRNVLRQYAHSGCQPDRRGRQGVRLHPGRHERRGAVGASESLGDARWFVARRSSTSTNASPSAGPSPGTRGCSFPSPRPTRTGRRRTCWRGRPRRCSKRAGPAARKPTSQSCSPSKPRHACRSPSAKPRRLWLCHRIQRGRCKWRETRPPTCAAPISSNLILSSMWVSTSRACPGRTEEWK